MSDNMEWFQKLLPPKRKEKPYWMEQFLSDVMKGMPKGEFRPFVASHAEVGGVDIVHVFLRDCSKMEVATGVSHPFDIFIDNHPGEKDPLAGFSLWGAKMVLEEQGYNESSISLEELIDCFYYYHAGNYGKNLFGDYDGQIVAIAREHQFVWNIPK